MSGICYFDAYVPFIGHTIDALEVHLRAVVGVEIYSHSTPRRPLHYSEGGEGRRVSGAHPILLGKNNDIEGWVKSLLIIGSNTKVKLTPYIVDNVQQHYSKVMQRK